MTSIAILGIGNNLLKDDGAGVHALTHIRDSGELPDVTCIDAGTVGLALMDHLADLDGIVALDAMRLGKPPGTVTVLKGAEMDDHLRHHRGSVHEVGLSDLVDCLRLADDLPARRALIGIEPAEIDWGTEPTDAVAAAVPEAAALAREIVRRWQSEVGSEETP